MDIDDDSAIVVDNDDGFERDEVMVDDDFEIDEVKYNDDVTAPDRSQWKHTALIAVNLCPI